MELTRKLKEIIKEYKIEFKNLNQGLNFEDNKNNWLKNQLDTEEEIKMTEMNLYHEFISKLSQIIENKK